MRKGTARSAKNLILLSLLGAFSFSAAFAAPKPSAQSYDSLEAKPLDQVFAHLDKTLKKLKNSRARALRQAYEQLQAKQWEPARNFAKTALKDSRFSDYAHWIIASAFYEEAAALATEDGKHAETVSAARNAFQHYASVMNDPYSALRHQALKRMGESQLLIGYGLSPQRGSVKTFEDAFARLQLNNGGVGAVLPEQVEAFAHACAKHSDELCIPWLMRLTEHMGHESDAFKAITELFPTLLDRPRAPVVSHATQPYHAPDLDSAAFEDALSSCLSGKWSDSAAKLQKFMDEFPKSSYRFRARYWLARAHLESKKEDEAKKELGSLQQDTPFSYYGILASIAAAISPDQGISTGYPLAAERDPALNAFETVHLKRAESLLAEKAFDLAGMELKELKPRSGLGSPFLMYLAGLNYRAESFPMLFTMLTELFQRGYGELGSQIILKMIFPIAQTDRISKYAQENGIDPVLVLSLIKQESAFDSHAISSSGAAGLMQLMFFTATDTVPGISRADLLEPEHNIRTGTRYLAKLLTRYHGNIVLSLAAYNAGPMAVDRWVREGIKQKYGMLEFIESIPYRETRDYVSSIIRNYFWYSKLLNTPLPQSLIFFWSPYGELNHEIGGPDLPVQKPSPSPSPSPTPTPSPKPIASPSASPRPSASASKPADAD